MKKGIILVLLLCFGSIMLHLNPSDAQANRVTGQRFKISRSGLEVPDYKKIILLTELDEFYAEDVGPNKIGLTEAMIRNKCESRLNEAGLEPSSNFSRPEYLFVSVNIRHRSFYILIQFNRPVQYQVEETKFVKYGAKIWEKGVLGQHGYTPDYIQETLDRLLGDFIDDYLKANSD